MKKIILCFFLFLTCIGYAQKGTPNSIENPEKAKDFLLPFVYSVAPNQGLIFIYISSQADTAHVIITCKDYPSFVEDITLPPYSDTIYRVPPTIDVILRESEEVSSKLMRVRSSSPIICIGSSGYSSIRDQFAGVSEDKAGYYFRVLTYADRYYHTDIQRGTPVPHLCVAAYYPGTEVTITPTEYTMKNQPEEVPINFMLDSGECVYLQSQYAHRNGRDLTGSIIISTKPVAVFAGHPYAEVPLDYSGNPHYGTHLYESIPPANNLGKGYIFQNSSQHREPELLRVLAVKNGTQVRLNGEVWGVALQEGEYLDTMIRATVLIEANEQILVGHYSASKHDSKADTPCAGFLAVLPPLESRCADQTFYVCPDTLFYSLDPRPFYTIQHVQIAVERSNKANVRLDGVLIPDSIFTDVPGSYDGKQFSVGSVKTSPGRQHRLTVPGKAENGFVFLVYGANWQSAYAYGSQMLYRKVDPLDVEVEGEERIGSSIFTVSITKDRATMTLRSSTDISGDATIEMFDALGRCVLNTKTIISGEECEIHLEKSTVSTGVYFVRVTTPKGIYSSKVMVVE